MVFTVAIKSDKTDFYKLLEGLEKDELARYFGVSEVEIVQGPGHSDSVTVKKDEHECCARCRNPKEHLEEVNGMKLCHRCHEAIGE